MRGRSWATASGALVATLLLVAPSGLSVHGTGELAATFPIQLWGPLEVDASRGGLVARGAAFEGALELVRGRVELVTLELDATVLGAELRRTTERIADSGLLELRPSPQGQLAAWGDARLRTEGQALLALPQGDVFAFQHGQEGRVVGYPQGASAVQATRGTGTVEGKVHLLLTDAFVRLQRGPEVRDLDLGPATEVRLPELRAADLPLGQAPALPVLGGGPAPLPELGAAREVFVKRFLEVTGEARLLVRSTGAPLEAFARTTAVHVLGAAHLPGALGEFALAGQEVSLRGDSAQAAGDFWLRTMPGGEDHRQVRMEGSFESFAVNGRVVEAPPTVQATVALAALAGAGLAAPLLKQGAGRLAGVLYARIPASDVLGSGPRRRIYEMVLAEPGISLSELASKSGLSWGATVHHLGVLRRTGLVASLRHGRYRRWFAPGACDQGERVGVAQLRNPVSARVAKLVLEQPGLSQKQLAERLGMSPQAVHWHLVRLHAAGLVDRVRDGREVHHFVRATSPGGLSAPAAAAPALPPALP